MSREVGTKSGKPCFEHLVEPRRASRASVELLYRYSYRYRNLRVYLLKDWPFLTFKKMLL
jgi:hypothetical protein